MVLLSVNCDVNRAQAGYAWAHWWYSVNVSSLSCLLLIALVWNAEGVPTPRRILRLLPKMANSLGFSQNLKLRSRALRQFGPPRGKTLSPPRPTFCHAVITGGRFLNCRRVQSNALARAI